MLKRTTEVYLSHTVVSDIWENAIYIKHHGIKIHATCTLMQHYGPRVKRGGLFSSPQCAGTGSANRTAVEANLTGVFLLSNAPDPHSQGGSASGEEDSASAAQPSAPEPSTSESSAVVSSSESESRLPGDPEPARRLPCSLLKNNQ